VKSSTCTHKERVWNINHVWFITLLLLDELWTSTCLAKTVKIVYKERNGNQIPGIGRLLAGTSCCLFTQSTISRTKNLFKWNSIFWLFYLPCSQDIPMFITVFTGNALLFVHRNCAQASVNMNETSLKTYAHTTSSVLWASPSSVLSSVSIVSRHFRCEEASCQLVVEVCVPSLVVLGWQAPVLAYPFSCSVWLEGHCICSNVPDVLSEVQDLLSSCRSRTPNRTEASSLIVATPVVNVLLSVGVQSS